MGDAKTNSKRNSANGSCLPTGVPESDESGEESEPTYRHYDHFETDVCLTQDEDEPLPSNVPIIQTTPTPRRNQRHDQTNGDPFSAVNGNRITSSDSDSCTETEMYADREQRRDSDGTTTTSTSESEETQIWVPVSKRPSTIKQGTNTNTPPRSTRASSSNDSDGQSRQPTSLPASVGLTTGSLSIIASPGAEIKVKDDTRRGSAQNTMTSVLSKRGVTNKHMSLGLLRHDEATGTITLDIHNVQNGDIDTDHTDDRDYPTAERRIRPVVPMESQHTQTGDICGLLSVLYAVIMMVTGLGVAVAEVYVKKPMPSLFEGFYIYLLFMSIGFLVFVFSYTVRLNTLTPDRVVVVRRTAQQKQGISTDNNSSGFYFRLGAVFFGIGSMIKSGLHFGESFEMTSVPECDNMLHAIRPMVQILFTFTQLYFVFFSSKIRMHHYHYIAKFGLMHMMATNVCIWFDNIVKETLRNLNHQIGHNSSNTDTFSQVVGSDCYGESLMGEVIRTSGPYLYSCTVQYSLIAASLLCVMWSKVDKVATTKAVQDEHAEQTNDNKADFDCSSSSRGLFLGIIVLVAVVITTITFFVLVQTSTYTTHALKLGHIIDITVYVIMMVSVILAYYRMNVLKYFTPGRRFEHILLFCSLIGVFILCVCNTIAGGFYPIIEHGLLLGISSIMQIIETSMQFIFLLSAYKRAAKTKDQEIEKPGREFVTFVLICNIAVWGLNLFIAQRWNEHSIQTAFYGDVSWNIILHVTEPFSLFFRFLSTVLLVHVWVYSWKWDSGIKQ